MDIDSSIYNDLISNINLEKIELVSLKCKQYSNNEGGNLASVDIKIKMKDIATEGNKLVIPSLFKVNSVDVETKENIFTIEFEYLLVYEFAINKTYDDVYFKEFSKKNAPLNVWPYARELVSTITSRMGFSSLFIPLYKSESR